MSSLPISQKADLLQDSYIGMRFEFKYLLDSETAKKVEHYLEHIGLEHDAHAKGGFYTVNTLYFDTPRIIDYQEKEGVLLKRKKLRGRIYTSDFNEHKGNVQFEIKHKYDMYILKKRVSIPNDVWQELLNGDTFPLLSLRSKQSPEEQKTSSDIAYFFLRHNYKPRLSITYFRKPYLTKFLSPIRITLDKEIKTNRVVSGESSVFKTAVYPRYTIMEVKFKHTLPWWFGGMVRRFNLFRIDFSKYNHATDALMRQYGRRIPR